jgi:hypothetical protein
MPKKGVIKELVKTSIKVMFEAISFKGLED